MFFLEILVLLIIEVIFEKINEEDLLEFKFCFCVV